MATVTRVNAATGEVEVIEVEDAEPSWAEADLLAYAAERRWRAETGGIEVAGMLVATDDSSQRKIAELRRMAELGEIALPFGFKAVSGWIDLGLPQIVAVDQAVAAHIQACYATERAVAGAIMAEDITSAAEIEAAFASGDPAP